LEVSCIDSHIGQAVARLESKAGAAGRRPTPLPGIATPADFSVKFMELDVAWGIGPASPHRFSAAIGD
jgi:hypothetical protein